MSWLEARLPDRVSVTARTSTSEVIGMTDPGAN